MHCGQVITKSHYLKKIIETKKEQQSTDIYYLAANSFHIIGTTITALQSYFCV